MNSRLNRIIVAYLLVFNVILLYQALNIFKDKTVGKFNIVDPDSLYIILSNKNHKDEIIFSYLNTTIGLGHDKEQVEEFAASFNLVDIDYYIDYTMYEELDENINQFNIVSKVGAYIVSVEDFNFTYVHNASDDAIDFVDSVIDSIDVLKLNCIDERLFQHQLFNKPIMNLIINKCYLSDDLLEDLYEQMIDIYINSNNRILIIKFKNELLSIMEWTL